MSEEKKEAVPTPAEDPKDSEPKVEAEDTTGNEPSGEAVEEALKIEKVDHEAELKAERERREKAEKALAHQRIKDKREKPEESIEGEDDEDKPLTKRELAEILAKSNQDVEKRFMATQIKEIAKNISSSPIEAELIVEIHKNRTWPSHLSLEEQLEESQLIANKKTLKGTISEITRAARGKAGVNTNPAGTHMDAPKAGEPKLARDEALVISQNGLKWNGVTRRYEKKLNGGKTLVRNSQTKQLQVI